MKLKPLHESCADFDPEEFTDFEKKHREAPVCRQDGKREDCAMCQAKRFAAKATPFYFTKGYSSPF